MNSRLAATKVLTAVICEGKSLSAVMATEGLTPLSKELCFGVLRYYEQLIFIRDQLLQRKLKNKDCDIGTVLLLGLYQLIHTRVAAHAAINETVAISKKLRKNWARGVINAVLRNYQRKSEQLLYMVEQQQVARFLHPQWLLSRFKHAWPEQWQDLTLANSSHPPMTLRINPQQVSINSYLSQLEKNSIAASKDKIAKNSITLSKPTPVSNLPGFEKGLASVQDQAAQLSASLLKLKPQQTVLDACAAPGGKTCAILEQHPDLSEVVALEVDPLRAKKITENLQRLKLTGRVVVADATKEKLATTSNELFDRVLVDAPCSATGVIRRHPDIKLLRRDEDIKNLVTQQQQILATMWQVLKPNGILLYATCSVLPEENYLQVENFIRQTPDAEHDTIQAEWGVAMPYGRQILTGQSDMDGFYYARIKKVKI